MSPKNASFDFNLIDKKWFWPIVGLCFLLLYYALRSVFTPFLVAVFIGYLCHPAVDWMARHHISRNIGSCLTILFICVILVSIVMVFLPLLQGETLSLMRQLPNYLKAFNSDYVAWLETLLGHSLQFDVQSVQQFFANNIANVSNMGVYALRYVSQRGGALISLVFNSLLVPIVLFYVLRDWHQFIQSLMCLVPRAIRQPVIDIADEMSDVLSKTIRGQLLVMAIQSFLYAFALWLAGLDFAFAIGIMTGVLSVIPYVGFSIGFITGLLTAALQFDSLLQVIPVLLAFGVVQFFESFFLTPRIVGDRIGIHPVGVIFSLLAFGELFGFTGVLLALPASSLIVVALRHLGKAYLHSKFYNGNNDGTNASGAESNSTAQPNVG